MDSQTLEPTVLDAQTLQQLQDEIQQEMHEILNKSNLAKVLNKYGISGQEVLKVQYVLDLSKYQFIDTDESLQAKKSLLPKLGKRPIEVALRHVKPCPIDNNPDGCWLA